MKLKALLVALAAIVGVQSYAWDGTTAGKVYLQNVGSGLWWGAGNDWGTRASLLQHPEYVTFVADGNNFKIESQVSNGGTAYYFNGDYMDNDSPVSLTITQVDDYWTIANGTTYYGYDGSSTVLGKGVDATTKNGQWRIYTESEMSTLLVTAKPDAPVDATFLIIDPNFGRNNRNETKVANNNWTGVWTMDASNQNLSGGNDTNNCAESWHSTFTLSQTLSNVPNGYYSLTAQGFYRQDGSDNDNLPYFYANSSKATFPSMGTLPNHDKSNPENNMYDASVEFTNGNYTIDPIYFQVTDGQITLGAKLETNTNLWCIFDNFVLTYYGTSFANTTLTNPTAVPSELNKETNSIPGWTATSNAKSETGAVTEYWNKSAASISQTLANMPAGYYTLTAIALTRDGMTATLAANDASMSIATVGSGTVNNQGGAVTWFNAGNGVNKLIFNHATAGDLTISLTADNTSGDHWMVWKSFDLLYHGESAVEYYKALRDEVQEEAKEYLSSLPAAAKANLQGVITEKGADFSTAQEYYDASLALRAAIATAKTYIAPYANYLTKHDAVVALKNQTDAYTDPGTAVSTFDEDVKAVDDYVDALTNIADFETAIANVRKAGAAFLGNIKVNSEKYLDITAAFLNNADFSDGNINGWVCTFVKGTSATNIGFQNNNTYKDADGNVKIQNFIEAWYASNKALGDGQLYQTVSHLPEGKYTLEVDAIAVNQGDADATTTGAQLYITADGADYTEALSTSNGVSKHFTTQFLNTGAGDVVFGLRTISTTANWICADNFVVKFYGVDLDPYDEKLAEEIAKAEAVTGKMNAEVAAALAKAITDYKGKTYSKSADYATAIAAVSDATNAANASISAYTTLKTKLDAVAAELANTNLYTAEAKKTNYDDVLAAYEDNSITDATANAYNPGDHYTGVYPAILLSTWSKDDVAATSAETGFYINTWSTEGNNDGSNFKTPFYEYWVGDGDVLAATTLTANVSGLTANGYYKVNVWGRVRQTNEKEKVAGSITLKVGSGKAIDLTAGTQVGSSALYLGEYAAIGKADASGNLTITISVAAESNISWLSFKNVTYEAVEVASDMSSIIALTTPTTKLGFEKDEYAPYEHVTQIQTAKEQVALATDELSTYGVVQKTTFDAVKAALEALTWTPNPSEVNAIPGSKTFAEGSYTHSGDYDLPNGWNNTGYNTRIQGISEGTNNKGLQDDEGNVVRHAMLVKYETSYGEEEGYTLPLKKNTRYEFSFEYGLWNEGGIITKGLTVTAPDGSTIEMTPATVSKNEGAKEKCGHNVNTAWYKYKAYFTTAEAGDYILNIVNTDAGNQRQMAFSDLELKKAVATDLALSEETAVEFEYPYDLHNVTLARTFNANWATFVVPFDIDNATLKAQFGDDVQVSTISASDKTGVQFTAMDEPAITANVPVIMKTSTTQSSFTFDNVIVQEGTPTTTPVEGVSVVGNYGGKVAIPGTTGEDTNAYYYIASNLMKHSTGSQTIKGFRAYFSVAADAEAKAFFDSFSFDLPTAVEGVEAASSLNNAVIYNVAGQRVSKLQRGVNIMNGKKVLVK